MPRELSRNGQVHRRSGREGKLELRSSPFIFRLLVVLAHSTLGTFRVHYANAQQQRPVNLYRAPQAAFGRQWVLALSVSDRGCPYAQRPFKASQRRLRKTWDASLLHFSAVCRHLHTSPARNDALTTGNALAYRPYKWGNEWLLY